MAHKILIVDDLPEIRKLIHEILKPKGYEIFLAADYLSAVQTLEDEDIDLVVSDMIMPEHDGIELLKHCRSNYPELIVILLTAYSTIKSAMEAIKLGAYDYLTKPFKTDKLVLTIHNAIKERDLLKENTALQNIMKKQLANKFIFVSIEMQKIASLIEKIAQSDVGPILIRGETGVGKEVVAKAIHNLSIRKNKPFLEVNCTSIQEKLLENELFGHEKGAFTDAKDQKKGLFEIASDGTLFLDEIGDIDLAIQIKLLRVLEDRKFFRLGGTQAIHTNARIIAATNKNLEQAITEKAYRKDLYYRLKIITLNIPPLRKRKNDIIPLAEYFMEDFNKKFKKNFKFFASNSEKILMEYNWPGNVRELRNMMERICLLEEDETIKVKHLPIEMFDNLLGLDTKANKETKKKNQDILDAALPESGKLITLKELEDRYIQKVMKENGNSRTKAADILGINRKTLWEKLKKTKNTEEPKT